jgi:hypothetical protein
MIQSFWENPGKSVNESARKSDPLQATTLVKWIIVLTVLPAVAE